MNTLLFRSFLLIFLMAVSFSGFSVAESKSPTPDTTKTEKANNKRLDFFISNLRKSQRKISENYFHRPVHKQICPYMKELKTMEGKGNLDSKKRKRFLKEVVKIYGKVFDFSSTHHIMYCLYNYYNTPEPAELKSIVKETLPKKKQRIFYNMLNICYKEDLNGNGDNLDIKKEEARKASLLSLTNYKKLDRESQIDYSQEVKEAYLRFENADKNEQNLFLLEARESHFSDPSFLLNILLPSALANPFKGKCLIGGVMRKVVYRKQLKRYICPALGNACKNQPNSFRCGIIFNNKCIPVHPVGSLTDRCYEASKSEPFLSENYNKNQSFFQSINEGYCKGSNKKSCRVFRKRLKEAQQIFLERINPPPPPRSATLPRRGPRPSPSDSSPSPSPSQALPQSSVSSEESPSSPSGLPPDPGDITTEAGATCTDCAIQPDKTLSSFKETFEIINPEAEKKAFLDYLSNTIYENATCKCQGNDGCTRGCVKEKRVSPPLVRCRSSKPITRTTEYCMRHVTGSIMKSIHTHLTPYCKEIEKENQTREDYEDCVIEVNQGKKELNICENSFSFPSALCALNLDGQSEWDKWGPAVYSSIKTKNVRRKCRSRDKNHNQALYSIPIVQDDGTVKNIPLFKKIPLEKIKRNGKVNPDAIPVGSVVVMTSSNPGGHGHVEIKTNKKECNGEFCFCSDHCRERTGERSYETQNFGVQAVFEWNPEIMKYMNKNRQ